ncbi:MAG: hypothetical protein CO170_02725 [candidate division SR1 bacterium CG_4_9_14_3_um_filter_40_9]|nr:MAG: hypothetical protein CO170_02725 [candidate division SR1 bacterium CG_4_9_14_3_um_filter_40_9]
MHYTVINIFVNVSFITHQGKMTSKIKVSYEDLQKRCITLADQIVHSGFKPDIVVSITRGGLLSAYFLADLIGVKSIEMVNIESKQGGREIQDMTKIIKDFSQFKVLIVDDLIDSGNTITYIFSNYKFDRPNTKIAVIYLKEGAKIQADFFVEKITDEWIIFPYHR